MTCYQTGSLQLENDEHTCTYILLFTCTYFKLPFRNLHHRQTVTVIFRNYRVEEEAANPATTALASSCFKPSGIRTPLCFDLICLERLLGASYFLLQLGCAQPMTTLRCRRVCVYVESQLKELYVHI